MARWSRLALPAACLWLAALWPGLGKASAQELPGDVRVGGGAYLWLFQPLDVDGAEGKAEIYALFLDLDRSSGPWEIHVQGRWRDTKLRSFYPSNVWIQEAWVSHTTELGAPEAADDGGAGGRSDDAPGADDGTRRRPELTLTAGKIYQRLGRFWDGSFFGNLLYFDGLKLDPELGVEASLRLPIRRSAALELYGQALLDSDRVNGALPGRDLEGEAGTDEAGLAAGARLEAPVARPGGDTLSGTLGLSGLLERAERGDPAAGDDGAPAAPPVDAELEHVAADLELRWRGAVAYLEWSRRAGGGPGALARAAPPGAALTELARGPAGSRATWWLAGARARIGPVGLRYNFSAADYDDAGFREYVHQPGVTVEAAPGVSLLVEYDDWRREGAGALADGAGAGVGGSSGEDGGAGGAPGGPGPDAADRRIDRSLNVVLLLEF